ncbi:hypothetical protein ADJ79_12265 [Ottowia sp. oral taxon 894]|nr:hypothetical protein ADJ79_12265 [Ottowia sp. oral taxon 894]
MVGTRRFPAAPVHLFCREIGICQFLKLAAMLVKMIDHFLIGNELAGSVFPKQHIRSHAQQTINHKFRD